MRMMYVMYLVLLIRSTLYQNFVEIPLEATVASCHGLGPKKVSHSQGCLIGRNESELLAAGV